MAFSSGQYKQKLQSKKGKVNQIKYKLKIYAYTDKKKNAVLDFLWESKGCDSQCLSPLHYHANLEMDWLPAQHRRFYRDASGIIP